MRDILIYLFSKSQSRVDELIILIATAMFINSRYKRGLAVILGGALITILMELWLGI